MHQECEQTLDIFKQINRSIKLKNTFDIDQDNMRKNIEDKLKKLAEALEKEK